MKWTGNKTQEDMRAEENSNKNDRTFGRQNEKKKKTSQEGLTSRESS